MDLVSQKFYAHESEAFSPIKSPPTSLFGSPLHSSHTSFPIMAVAVIGILATTFLMVSYYIFVNMYCLNWHRIDLLRGFSMSRRQRVDGPLTVYSPAVESRGLNEAAIRSIPIFKFKKGEAEDHEVSGVKSWECAVCLNEFQEKEKLRVIPNCGHVFHIDCIDIWLQNNASCPLCRISIVAGMPNTQFPVDQILAPSSSPQDPTPHTDNFTGRDEDYVVIEIGSGSELGHVANQSFPRIQESLNSGELLSISPPRKLETKISRKMAKKNSHVSSMGDEFIDNRQKDEEFVVQPIRRSFSMDSAADSQLYLAAQEIIQRNGQVNNGVNSNECCSNKVKRSFFSFGQGRGSRSAVQPVTLDP